MIIFFLDNCTNILYIERWWWWCWFFKV